MLIFDVFSFTPLYAIHLQVLSIYFNKTHLKSIYFLHLHCYHSITILFLGRFSRVLPGEASLGSLLELWPPPTQSHKAAIGFYITLNHMFCLCLESFSSGSLHLLKRFKMTYYSPRPFKIWTLPAATTWCASFPLFR